MDRILNAFYSVDKDNPKYRIENVSGEEYKEAIRSLAEKFFEYDSDPIQVPVNMATTLSSAGCITLFISDDNKDNSPLTPRLCKDLTMFNMYENSDERIMTYTFCYGNAIIAVAKSGDNCAVNYNELT